ncbi:hypothetical protein HDU93_005137 [Gonapodya sp. JEL0774]|nr:hypothetical protein HDU93_005137 [Gonapodya sp. JEL0774]
MVRNKSQIPVKNAVPAAVTELEREEQSEKDLEDEVQIPTSSKPKKRKADDLHEHVEQTKGDTTENDTGEGEHHTVGEKRVTSRAKRRMDSHELEHGNVQQTSALTASTELPLARQDDSREHFEETSPIIGTAPAKKTSSSAATKKKNSSSSSEPKFGDSRIPEIRSVEELRRAVESPDTINSKTLVIVEFGVKRGKPCQGEYKT